MRPHMRPYPTIPKRIEVLEDYIKEATYFYLAYKKAKTPALKNKVLYGLIANARKWDILTRTFYYSNFEKLAGKEFDIFWKKDLGWNFIKTMNCTLFKRGCR